MRTSTPFSHTLAGAACHWRIARSEVEKQASMVELQASAKARGAGAVGTVKGAEEQLLRQSASLHLQVWGMKGIEHSQGS